MNSLAEEPLSIQQQVNNELSPDHASHGAQDRRRRDEARLRALPRLPVLAPEPRVVAHAGGLALDGAALRRAEALLGAAMTFIREHSREEVARADRCATSECAPGQHGSGVAEAAAVQQCSRKSARGEAPFARSHTAENRSNLQPLRY